jgi:hypothetical protein
MSALIALLIAPAFAQDVLINEVLYDSDEAGDDGFEWVELCNAGTSAVDLAGWTLEGAGSTFGSVTVGGSAALTGTLAPGDYVLVGFGSLTNPGALFPNLQNGGSATDGVRIKDGSGTVVDTVLYDTNNTNGLFDDTGAAGTSFAPDVGAGHSIARFPDCTDTNDSGADFVDMDTTETTPGGENLLGGGTGGDTGGTACDNPAAGTDIKINEFEPNPNWSDDTTDAAREWVELVNVGGGAVDVSGWQLQFETNPDDWGAASGTFVIPAGTSIDPGGFLVLAGDDVPALFEMDPSINVITVSEADTRDISMGTASSNADGVRIVDCEGTPVDTALYGHQDGVDDLERNSDGFLDDSGAVSSSLAPKGSAGAVIGRNEDGLDTDASGDDFSLMLFPTPGYSNTTEPDCPGLDDIKINEFLVAPEGGGNGGEFIELYNAGAETIDLTDWGVGSATSGNPSYLLLDNVSIGAGDYLVIAGSDAVPGAQIIDADMNLGNATSNADLVRVLHACGLPADSVIYGPTYLDDEGAPVAEWVDDSGVSGAELDDRLAPKAGTGEAIARCRDGEDTDDSYADFVIDLSPTPGAANPDTGCIPPEPPRCEPGEGTVKINEMYPNPDGTDSGNEWIELVNTGSETAVIDAWMLQWGTSSFGSDVSFPAGTEIPPGGFLLVGDSEVPADVYAGISLGNASTAPDGVRLVDCREDGDPVVQDTVLYGGLGEAPEDAELLDDAGGQTMAVMPSEGMTVGRMPDGEDSDDNGADFVTDLAPTPGAANALPTAGDDGDGGDGGDEEPKGCGCSGDKSTSSGKDTDKSCAVVEPRGGLIVALLALVTIRRRRDDD